MNITRNKTTNIIALLQIMENVMLKAEVHKFCIIGLKRFFFKNNFIEVFGALHFNFLSWFDGYWISNLVFDRTR